ncbi:MAG: DNA-3-methyladenine glycosylase 2 family protein [Bacteroidia bacterium]|nr:DNA-3-methyladenine glycosylase 2 family protein [Bacteroidia bacterium]
MTEAYKALKSDPVMKEVIRFTGRLEEVGHKDLFTSLLRSIVGQQLSGKAADTIWSRFIALFPRKKPTADALLAIDIELLRGAGLSYQKAGYLKNIALFSKEQTLDYRKLHTKTDEELIEYLTSIKGVGKWTVEMILIFTLNRQDVFPLDDLGIQQAMVKLFNLRKTGKELKKEMLKRSAVWAPYRSLATRHLWNWKDNQ